MSVESIVGLLVILTFLVLLTKLLHIQDRLDVLRGTFDHHLGWVKSVEKKLLPAEFTPEQERALKVSSNINAAVIDYWVYHKVRGNTDTAEQFRRLGMLLEFNEYWQKEMQRRLEKAKQEIRGTGKST